MSEIDANYILGQRAWWASDLREATNYLSAFVEDADWRIAKELYFAKYLLAFCHSVLAALEEGDRASHHALEAEKHIRWLNGLHESVVSLRARLEIPEAFEGQREAVSWASGFIRRIENRDDAVESILAASLPPTYAKTNFQRMLELVKGYALPDLTEVGIFRLTTQDLGTEFSVGLTGLGREPYPSRR